MRCGPWVITLFDGSCPPVLCAPHGRDWRQGGECAVPLNNLSLPSWLVMFANRQNARGGEQWGLSGRHALRQQSSKQRGSQLGADNDSDWRRPTVTWGGRSTATPFPPAVQHALSSHYLWTLTMDGSLELDSRLLGTGAKKSIAQKHFCHRLQKTVPVNLLIKQHNHKHDSWQIFRFCI